jgi:carbonic anhydrase
MRLTPVAYALAFALFGCSGGHDGQASHNEPHPAIGPAEADAATAAHSAPTRASDHWGYENQRAWAGESGTCGGGQEQSPINLASAAPMSDLADLTLRYRTLAGRFVNNGHTLQFTPADASTLDIGSESFDLAQFHFHSPAEHTLDRRAYPIELHFVHRNEVGQLAVIGIFIEQGAENSALAQILASLPRAHGDAGATELEVNLMALLPPDRAYFAYAGSLTTPPCTEGVRWNVMRTPITASADQIARMREALGATARHVQPINERTVLLGR